MGTRRRRWKPLEHKAFKIAVLLKLIDGALEVLGAVAVWMVHPATVATIVRWVTADELAEDPKDFLAAHAVRWSLRYSNSTRWFAAAYLLLHGTAKVVLVVALLRRKLWAYPILVGVLLLFIGYQCYRLAHTHSILLGLFTLFDGLIVWLVWREYRRLLHERRDVAR